MEAAAVAPPGPPPAPPRKARARKPAAASPDGTSPGDGGLAAAERALAAEPWGFGFFQAVRLLERLRPGRARVGFFGDPAAEVVRFGVNPSIAFPPSELHGVELEGEVARMSVNFLGLTGPQGVLPLHYTLLVRHRARAKEPAPGEFLDLFHHRLLSLFYRAWEKHRIAVAAERGERDPLRRHLLDLLGEGGEAARRELPEEALAWFAGALAPPSRGAVALEQVLEECFGVPAAVEQFVGGWVPLDDGELCRLGEDDGGDSDALGWGAVAGAEVWHPQSRIRVVLGPLSKRDYDRFLPTGGAHGLLKALVRFHTHDQFECEVRLVLARDEVPGCVLGAADAEPLGWSTWVRTRPFAEDAGDTLLRL
ncbi:MAG TPA: type VI secretion system baseplate subunit TssG [Longimicrobium sp.]